MLLDLTHTLDIDGVGILTLEFRALTSWETGADDPSDDGHVCEECTLTGGVLKDERGLHTLNRATAAQLYRWAGHSLARLTAHIAERAVEEATAAGSARYQAAEERADAIA